MLLMSSHQRTTLHNLGDVAPEWNALVHRDWTGRRTTERASTVDEEADMAS
jgi:hypothetical protein